ncbi:MAG: hypothetical protein ACR2GW_01260 [Pyrinomonadaceae bacterium]
MVIIAGICLAALGGAIAYRAAFLSPANTFMISGTGSVREIPYSWRFIIGLVLLVVGAGAAFFAARRRA